MAIDYNALALPKGQTRKQVKAKRQRAERTVVRSVRAQCVARDGFCKYAQDALLGGVTGHIGIFDAFAVAVACSGRSELAHFADHRRLKTRGQQPEQRHTTAGSLMLCTKHHQDYDAHRLQIRALSDRGCDGPLEFSSC